MYSRVKTVVLNNVIVLDSDSTVHFDILISVKWDSRKENVQQRFSKLGGYLFARMCCNDF